MASVDSLGKLGTLRKRMKKNAVWSPKVNYDSTRLKKRNRGIEAIRAAKPKPRRLAFP